MSGEWAGVRLGGLVKVHHGFAFKGKHFTDSGRDVVLTPGNFRIGGGFQMRPGREKYYRGPVPDAYVLAPGELIVTMTDLSKTGDTLGYPALVPESEHLRFLHNQRLGRVEVLEPNRVDTNFLYYRLCCDDYRHEVLGSATGTTVRHTAPRRIEAFEFDLPSLAEQQAIVEVLGALDDKIALNRRMNRTLEDMAAALFRSWFVDFDPVVAKADGRAPFAMDAETAALFPDAFVDSEEGPIPEGWSFRPLDQIADFQNGLALQRYRPRDDATERLPVVKIAQLRSGRPTGGGWARADIKTSCVLDDGDIVFSWSGTLMVRVWCGGRAALNQHLFKVTSGSYPSWFPHRWVLQHLPEFQAIAAEKATTMGHIRRYHLTEALCVVAPEPVLSAASRFFIPWSEQHVEVARQSRTLVALRDSLLPQLLSGNIRLKDAEKLVGEA